MYEEERPTGIRVSVVFLDAVEEKKFKDSENPDPHPNYGLVDTGSCSW